DIDLLKMPGKSLHHAFVINNAAQPPSKKLQQALSAQGVTVTQENLSGLERMMKQSEITEVPVDNVTAILDWLNNVCPEEQKNRRLDEHVIVPMVLKPLVLEHCHERPLFITAERPLFGILTEPPQPDHKKP